MFFQKFKYIFLNDNNNIGPVRDKLNSYNQRTGANGQMKKGWKEM